MTVARRRKALRHRVVNEHSTMRDVGEALRDLDDAIAVPNTVGVVELQRAVWALPFSFPVDARPKLVTLGDARLAGTLEAVSCSGALQWTPESSQRVRIDTADALSEGVAYDLKFQVVY